MFQVCVIDIDHVHSILFCCHNLGQPKTKSPRVVLLSVRKPHHHTTGDHYIYSTSRQPRKLSFGIQPQLEEIWKATSILL